MAFRNVTNEAPMSPRYARYWTTDGMQIVPVHSDAFDWKKRLPYRVDPNAVSTSQLFPLGTELHYGTRSWYYGKAGGAITAGNLAQSVVPLAGHINEAINVPAVGDTTIDFTPAVVTTDDLAADELADGYIHINSGTGLGHMYRIKSHPAIAGAASGTLTLYDPIVVAPVAASLATVIHNRFRGAIVHDSPQTAMLVGVPTVTMANNDFGWFQYRGPCAVLVQGVLVIGDSCVPSATTDGAVMPSAAIETDGPVVGHVIAVNATTEYAPIWLCLP